MRYDMNRFLLLALWLLALPTVTPAQPKADEVLGVARLANDYERGVFAFPGRPSDLTAEGCNLLIRRNGATLITSADDLLNDLGWQSTPAADNNQKTLFPDLTADEQAIVDALSAAGNDLALTDLSAALDTPSYKITPLTLALEMKGVIKVLPGSRYHLIGS